MLDITEYFDIKGENSTTMYCVYEHWLNNDCFYVGCGDLDNNRPYETNSRNKKWWDFCKGEFEVKIIKTFKNRKEALEFEKELTIKRKNEGHPLANIAVGYSFYGKNNGMYGKGYLLKGKPKSEEHKEKLRIANVGLQSGEKMECMVNIIPKSLKEK